MREDLADGLVEALTFLACYLVLTLCGWALDHVLVDQDAEPAP